MSYGVRAPWFCIQLDQNVTSAKDRRPEDGVADTGGAKPTTKRFV